MTAADINNSLYRPILNGSEFDVLIPASDCKTVNLGKGNTGFTIKEMSKWAKKYAYQTLELSDVLVKDTLEETINTIQWFLYNHFHYNIDGEDQNLKSPACGWATRKEGFDCKSYSIFASTILLNLGIKHFLRRIKQDTLEDAFTHVYVVIPKNQNITKLPRNAQFSNDYYIIDGTIEQNIELPFNEKDDLYMEPSLPVYGLAAALNGRGLGCGNNADCGCGNTQVAETPYMSPALNGFQDDSQLMEEAFGRFFDFLENLKAQGVPAETVEQAVENLKYFVSIGVEPTLGDLLSVNPNYMGYGLAAGNDDEGSSLEDATGFLGIITALFPKEFFSNTFGSVFANGFDLSCWNASYSEQKAKAHIEVDMPFIVEWSAIHKNPSSANMDKFQLLSESYLLDAIHGQSSKYASCTRKGHALRQKAVEELRKNTYESFQNNGYILSDNGRKTQNIAIPSGFPGYGAGIPWNRTAIPYDSLKVTAPVQTVNPDVSDTYIDENGNLVSIPNTQPQQAGFGIGSILLFAGVAFGAWKSGVFTKK